MRIRRTSTWRVRAAVTALMLQSCQTPAPAKHPGQARSTPWPVAEKQLTLDLIAKRPSVPFDPVVGVLSAELDRSIAAFQSQSPAPYFLGFHVVERDATQMTASDGVMVDATNHESRSLDVDLRVGSRDKDNTHRIPGEERNVLKTTHPLPLDYSDAALRNAIWLATDSEYDTALAEWHRVEALDEVANDSDHTDFSAEEKVVFAEPKLETPFDEALWAQRLRSISRISLEFPEVQRSSVGLSVLTETRYQLNSEGTRLQLSRRSARLELQAQTVAADGMVLARFDSIELTDLDALPPDEEIANRFRRTFLDVRALVHAEVIEPYVGPAILDGRASGVFFHEVFGHRVEGHRQDAENEGQTFSSMVGQKIMFSGLSIYDDPNVRRLNGVDLNGTYPFDDEGVPAERALLVERGVLQGFLLSRAAARGFDRSNGHGRREPGHAVVARQANLIIDPGEPVSRATLEQALLQEVKRQNLPYGLRFAEIVGGYTQTQRYDTQAFKVIPVMVYKVYPDGREELVRGVDIEGTPLTALSKIVAAANDFEVFNGVCGAESGWVPVSATSPSILLSQIEVARQEHSDLKPPTLPPPGPSIRTRGERALTSGKGEVPMNEVRR